MTTIGPIVTDRDGLGSERRNGLWDLFVNSVRSRPSAIAVADPTLSYTYQGAYDRVLTLASALIGSGVEVGDIVLACFDRTADAILGSLAVHAVGGTVLPVEVDCPPVRLEAILDSAHPRLALGDARGRLLLEGTEIPFVAVTDAPSGPVAEQQPSAHADVAYLLYTSGSTGTPKGVEVSHANLLALLDGVADWETSTTEDVWACLTAFTFDVSLWEVWRPLSIGAQVFVMPRSAGSDTAHLQELIATQRVTSLCLTPTAIRIAADAGGSALLGRTVRRIFIGGEGRWG